MKAPVDFYWQAVKERGKLSKMTGNSSYVTVLKYPVSDLAGKMGAESGKSCKPFYSH